VTGVTATPLASKYETSLSCNVEIEGTEENDQLVIEMQME